MHSKMLKYFIFCLVSTFFIRTEGCRECPQGIQTFACTDDPCRERICEGATCSSNYCGGCNRLWYQNGNDVTKHCEFKCPTNCLPGCTVVNCFVDPCSPGGTPISCPGFPSAKCCSIYCGGCHAVWYSNGEPVTCQKTSTRG
ncbi:keratin-associated protein 9-6-like [Mytilus edulis]|uniref:keratin-associated protein 9-6-like n=1 Tax=Mytilus edulis TaxID=6550 RepID=UPI0039EE85A7